MHGLGASPRHSSFGFAWRGGALSKGSSTGPGGSYAGTVCLPRIRRLGAAVGVGSSTASVAAAGRFRPELEDGLVAPMSCDLRPALYPMALSCCRTWHQTLQSVKLWLPSKDLPS